MIDDVKQNAASLYQSWGETLSLTRRSDQSNMHNFDQLQIYDDRSFALMLQLHDISRPVFIQTEYCGKIHGY